MKATQKSMYPKFSGVSKFSAKIIVIAAAGGILWAAVFFIAQERVPQSLQSIPMENIPSQESKGIADITPLLAHVPPINASKTERQEYFKMVWNASEDNNFLTITGCDPVPKVLRVKEKARFFLVNRGSDSRSLVVDLKRVYVVAPNDVTIVSAEFGQGAGLYGYGCDDSEDVKGLILVTKE